LPDLQKDIDDLSKAQNRPWNLCARTIY